MSIRDAGKTIREARLKAGLTQEQLSEGVCSVLSLSRIENGSSGVSPSTFQALMAHAGAPCEVYPIFANRQDFDCFYTLKRARFYLDSWQLQESYDELEKIEKWSFADNKFYYQEWLYLHGRLLVRSDMKDHQVLFDLFSNSLHITRPHVDFSDFRNMLLSITEIELFIAIAQEFLYLDQADMCLAICSQIFSYLSDAEISQLEKDRLFAEHAITYAKYLLYTKDYKKALSIADSNRHKMVQNSANGLVLELNFLTALSYYYTGDFQTAYEYFKNTFYSAHSIESCYATICRNYIYQQTTLSVDNYLKSMPDIPCICFPIKKAITTSDLSDGTYDLFSPDVLTFGKLIHALRTEQDIPQTVLCQGLCSKSKLSKIEHDTLQPDIFLAEALLQRLGISEREFVFWGNERESKIYQLKFKLMHSHPSINKNFQCDLEELKSLACEKDFPLLQLYAVCYIKLISSSYEKIDILTNALSYTLPNFDIRVIHNYRLSWIELSLLNNIAHEYRTIDAAKSNFYFSKLLDYLSLNSLDILYANQIYGMTIYMYSHSLYIQKHYNELIDLLISPHYHLLKCHILNWGYFLFYYSQSLGECQNIREATRYSHYACCIQEQYELKANSDALKKYMWEDFSIII